MHVPKAGSTFQNIFFRAACRILIPTPFLEAHEVQHLEATRCPHAMRRHGFGDGHPPASMPADFNRGRVLVTMLRKPWRRALSGFYHMLHDCPQMQKRYGVSEHGRHVRVGDPNVRVGRSRAFYANITAFVVREYAACIGACMTRMLTGFRCGDERAPVRVELALWALSRAGFVGITEEWNATIELFAARFHAPTLPFDFDVQRQQRYNDEARGWVRALLEATPFVDDTLYARARAMLNDALRDKRAGRDGDWRPPTLRKRMPAG
jgi:hypothetical protein